MTGPQPPAPPAEPLTDPCPKGGNHNWLPTDYVTQGGRVRAYDCPKCHEEKDGPA